MTGRYAVARGARAWDDQGMPDAARVLIVANRTAATPALLDAVRERAARGPVGFTLLVPQLVSEEAFGEDEARLTIELAVPLLQEAAGGDVPAIIGTCDAMLAVERVLVHERFDEVIVSTLPERISHWLKRDLPTRIERLGMPVTVVRARQPREPLHPPIRYAGP
jgi:hypothetical protein